jgi:hypothetical protein
MNKAVAFFLITVFLCANTSIGQLLKVPNLIEHYKEHKNEVTTASNSFIQFIKVHYSKNTRNNQEEHQDLPFKTFQNNTNILFASTFLNFDLIPKKIFFEVNKNFFYKNSLKSNFFISIWLPPKIA